MYTVKVVVGLVLFLGASPFLWIGGSMLYDQMMLVRVDETLANGFSILIGFVMLALGLVLVGIGAIAWPKR